MTGAPHRFYATRVADNVWRVCWFDDDSGRVIVVRDSLGHNRARSLARTLNDALEAR